MTKQFNLLLLFCLLGFSQVSKAQYVDSEFPLLPPDSFTFIDSGSTIIIDSSYMEYSCFVPEVRANAVAYYVAGPIAYIRIGNDIPSGTLFYIKSGSGTRSLVTPSGNDLIISSLLLDTEYILETHNTCGEFIEFAEIDTRRINNYGAIELSAELFDSIAEFSIAFDTSITLYQYVKDLTGSIHNLEKIAYLQSFFQDSISLIPNTFISGWQIPTELVLNKKPSCNCKFEIRNEPITAAYPANHVNGQLWGKQRSEYHHKNHPIKDPQFYYWEQYQGPSRYMVTDFKGNGGEHSHEFQQGGEPNGSPTSNHPYRAELVYNYTCVNQATTLALCGCERKLDVEYLYESVLKAYAETNDCTLCFSERYASAQIEDLMIVTVYHAATQQKEILNAGLKQAYGFASHSVNKEFLHDMVDILGDGVLVGFQWYSGIITPGLIDSTREVLHDFIELDKPIHDSSIHISPVTMARSGRHTIIMQANDPTIITLAVNGKTLQSGEKYFKTSTELVSAFRLSAIHISGETTVDPDCCGPVTGSWVLSTQSGKSNYTYSDLQLAVSNHLNQWGGWWSTPYIAIDYGRLNVIIFDDCGTTIEKTINNSGLNDGFGLNIINESLILEYAQDELDSLVDNNSTYTVYNVTGKILSTGTIGSDGYLCKSEGITEQVLFVEVKTKKGIQRYKLYIVSN